MKLMRFGMVALVLSVIAGSFALLTVRDWFERAIAFIAALFVLATLYVVGVRENQSEGF